MILELLSPFISSGIPLPKGPDNHSPRWSTEIPEGVIITVVWHWHLRPASDFKPEKKINQLFTRITTHLADNSLESPPSPLYKKHFAREQSIKKESGSSWNRGCLAWAINHQQNSPGQFPAGRWWWEPAPIVSGTTEPLIPLLTAALKQGA